MVLTKYPEETLTFSFDFSARSEIADQGQTLTSAPTVGVTRKAGSGSIVIGAPSISGSKVNVVISGGSLGDSFVLLCQVGTSGGSVLAEQGTLSIKRT
jgi:hypothetical protein